MTNKKINKKHWAYSKERGSLLGIYFLSYVFKFLGAHLCKIFMMPVLMYFYLFNASARKNIKQFLTNMHETTETQISPSQWNVFRVILNFGYGIIDKLSAWSGKLSLDQLNSVNDKAFRQLESQGMGAILLVSHLGNFEICRVASEQRSQAKFNIFMHTKNSQKISKVMTSINSKYSVSIIQGDELTMPMVMILKEKVDAGEFIVIAGDRVPVNNPQGAIELEFLNQKAQFPIGPYVLSKVLGCPIINLFCLKNKNKYDVYFDLLTNKVDFNKNNRNESIQRIAKKYIKCLEFYAEKAPLQWYNFHQFWINK